MDKENSVYDDIMQGLHEVEEYQKGNIKLKSNVVTIDDDDIINKFNQLSNDSRRIIETLINKLLTVEKLEGVSNEKK